MRMFVLKSDNLLKLLNGLSLLDDEDKERIIKVVNALEQLSIGNTPQKRGFYKNFDGGKDRILWQFGHN